MNGSNGIVLGKNGVILNKQSKKQPQRVDDPELQAEIRWAKENGLAIPKMLPSEALKQEASLAHPRALSQRNRKSS
jgi:hypothetical protein